MKHEITEIIQDLKYHQLPMKESKATKASTTILSIREEEKESIRVCYLSFSSPLIERFEDLLHVLRHRCCKERDGAFLQNL